MTTTRGTYWIAKSPEEKLLEQMIIAALRENGLTGWTVIFSRTSQELGHCNSATKEICISRKVIRSDWAVAVDTAMHEVAHALTPGHGHGTAWQVMAKALGATPKAKVDNYAHSHELGERKKIKTNYGPLEIVLGSDTPIYGAVSVRPSLRKVEPIELKQKSCICRDEKGKLYNLPLDYFHPSYGDTSKIIQRRVMLKSDRGRPVPITIGKSYFIENGVRYIAIEPKLKKVVAISSSGRRLLVPAEFMRED